MRHLTKQLLITILTATAVAASLLAATDGLTRPGFLGQRLLSPSSAADSDLAAQSAALEAAAVQKAPDFRLTDIRGRNISLASLRGKVAIIDFWATWCPPCRMEIPILNGLQAKYRRQGLEVVGISLDDHVDEVRAFIRHTPLNYTVAHGNEKIVSQFGGIAALPTVFFLDRRGNIRTKHVGLTSQSALEQEVQRLLSE